MVKFKCPIRKAAPYCAQCRFVKHGEAEGQCGYADHQREMARLAQEIDTREQINGRDSLH